MSILFSRITNPFNRPKTTSSKPHHRPRPGFIDPSVVKTWHWNYGGDFYVVKFRTDTMQIWVNDKEVTFQPSFAQNEGHIEFEAGRQKCEIRVSVGKNGASDCRHGRSNDVERACSGHHRRHHNNNNKAKLVYKLFVEGVSLGLPDSVEALIHRATSAVTTNLAPLLPGANDEQRRSLLSDTAANSVQTQGASTASSNTKRPEKMSQLNMTLMNQPIYTAAGDPREDDECLSTDLQSLLIA